MGESARWGTSPHAWRAERTARFALVEAVPCLGLCTLHSVRSRAPGCSGCPPCVCPGAVGALLHAPRAWACHGVESAWGGFPPQCVLTFGLCAVDAPPRAWACALLQVLRLRCVRTPRGSRCERLWVHCVLSSRLQPLVRALLPGPPRVRALLQALDACSPPGPSVHRAARHCEGGSRCDGWCVCWVQCVLSSRPFDAPSALCGRPSRCDGGVEGSLHGEVGRGPSFHGAQWRGLRRRGGVSSSRQRPGRDDRAVVS